MNTATNTKLHIHLTRLGDTATIHLNGQFVFDAHREFKSAYMNQLADPEITRIAIDLAGVRYLDSSALGMLLVLRDRVLDCSKSLTLSQPSTIAARTFEIAGFKELFHIH
jgi:anti-anti-sigma factor